LNANYYHSVQQAFDSASNAYDKDEAENPTRRIMRAHSIKLLRATFHPGQRILEIGCGTGTEAIALAKSGMKIVATDISPQMIARTRQRVLSRGLQDRITMEQLPAHDIGMLDEEYGPKSFDGAYSSFGALNCEPRLNDFVLSLAGLLKPDSSFVCSVMNKFCLFDFALNSLLFKRTNRLACMCAPLGTAEVLTSFYSVGEFTKMFVDFFTIRQIRALLTFLPPPYFEKTIHLLKPAPTKISDLDWELGKFYPFNRFGDHFIVIFRKLGGK